MRILEVSLGLGASSGGPVRSITGLTTAMSRLPDCDVCYFVHNPSGLERFDLGNTKVYHGSWDDHGNDFSGDFERVLDEVSPDLVHFHGLWHLTLHHDQRACRKRKIPYLVAPRGSLDAWSMRQKWLKKWLAMRLFQLRDLRHALALHVTAEMEMRHCRRQGCNGRYIISPNGVNLPPHLPERQVDSNRRRALFVSRMHPKKGCLELVRAWARVRPQNWVCEMVYTLNTQEERAYEEQVKAAVEANGLSDSFVFTGALDDIRKWDAYRRADLFVLPTHTENFGIVIAEAMYAGLPVLTTKNAPWEALESKGCGWWIELTPEDLAQALRSATSSDRNELERKGEMCRQHVIEQCSWPAIAERFVIDCKQMLKEAR